MSIGVSGSEAEIFCAKPREIGHFFVTHVMLNTFGGPIEEHGTDLTSFARNLPSNGTRGHIVSFFIELDGMATAFFEVAACLVEVANDDVYSVTESQHDEVAASGAAIRSSFIGMVIVDMDSHESPHCLAGTL